MIGFREQNTVRRPIYSITGVKLGYLVSGPDGEWWTNLNGRKIGRIKEFRRAKLPDVSTSVGGGGTYISLSEIDS